MLSIRKGLAVTAGLAILAGTAIIGTSPVSADGTGQIEGGNSIYVIKNLTENTPYANPASAKACEEIEYSVRLHNTGFVAVNNIHLTATLPGGASTSNTSTMTATYTDGVVPSTTATATVNLDSAQSISYESGTTKLYDGNGNLMQTLGDSVTTSGVSLGSINGSTTEFLNFKAKISCPTPPAPVFSCDALIVTAGDNRTVTVSAFNVTAQNGATFKNADLNWGDSHTDSGLNPVVGKTHQYSQDGTYTIAATAHFTVNGQDKTAGGVQCEKQVTFTTNKPPVVTPPTTTPTPTPAAPTQLVNTGPGSVAGIFAAVTIAGAAAYRWTISRRLSRQ